MSCRHDLAIGTCLECLQTTCPDGGTCHHGCALGAECWRVPNAEPLSGVFPDNKWPPGDSLDGPGAVPKDFTNEPMKLLATGEGQPAAMITFGLGRLAMSASVTAEQPLMSAAEGAAWRSLFADSVAFMCIRDTPPGGDNEPTTFENARLILEFRTRVSLERWVEQLTLLLASVDEATPLLGHSDVIGS